MLILCGWTVWELCSAHFQWLLVTCKWLRFSRKRVRSLLFTSWVTNDNSEIIYWLFILQASKSYEGPEVIKSLYFLLKNLVRYMYDKKVPKQIWTHWRLLNVSSRHGLIQSKWRSDEDTSQKRLIVFSETELWPKILASLCHLYSY